MNLRLFKTYRLGALLLAVALAAMAVFGWRSRERAFPPSAFA
jgi:hypothetical protein